MFLVLHIVLAIAAIAVSTLSLFSPSSRKLTLTYILTTGTLLAAAGLVTVDHASIGRACLTAFVYLSVISVNVFFTRKKLAKEVTAE